MNSTAAARRPRRRVLPLVVLAVVLVALVAWYALAKSQSTTAPQVPRESWTVTRSTQHRTVTADGKFQPRRSSYLSFPTPGKVTSVRVAVGDKVDKGDRLASIDDESLRSAVTVARAQVDAAREQLQVALDDNTSRAAITSARAGVQSAEQQLILAEEELDQATITSPIDGVVAAVNVTEGERSGTGSNSSAAGSDPLAGMSGGEMGGGSGMSGGGGFSSDMSGLDGGSQTSDASSADIVVVEPDRWKAEADLSTVDRAQVKKGQKATVTPTGSADGLKAKVTEVGVIADSSGGQATFPLSLEIDGRHDDLYIGSTNTVTITTGTYRDALTVPTAALISRDGKTMVTKLTDGQENEVPVTLGETFGAQTQITDGVAEGDVVVYDKVG